MRSLSLVLLCLLVIYIITIHGVSGKKSRKRCPEASELLVRKRRGRRNQKSGVCRIRANGKDTCTEKGQACCENYAGDYICVTRRQRRQKVANLESPPPMGPFHLRLDDEGTVQSPNCPQPDRICDPVSGQCAIGCAGYVGDEYTNCTDTGTCANGSICCDDPCDYGKAMPGRLCFPDENSTPEHMPFVTGVDQLAFSSVPIDEDCPTSDEICELIPCDNVMCPKYNDDTNKLCQSNDDCTDDGVCCPVVDICANLISEKRCHPKKSLTQEQPIPEAPRLPSLDDGLSGDVSDMPDLRCPAPIFEEGVDEVTNNVIKVPACAGYARVKECTESGECPVGMICCQDPCGLVQEVPPGETAIELRFCFEPVPEIDPESAAAVAMADEMMECPSKEETCSRLDCNDDMCPKYDATYTNCSSNMDCVGDSQLCCSSQCGDGKMLCHPTTTLDVKLDSPALVQEADSTDDEDQFVCPRPMPDGCIGWIEVPGQPGTGICTENTDCATDRLCCQLDNCDGFYCTPRFDKSSLLNPGCPTPFYTLPDDIMMQLFEVGECNPGECADGQICCAMSVFGDRICVDP